MPHLVIEHSDLQVNFRELLILLIAKISEAYPAVIAAPAVKGRAINVGQDWAVGTDAAQQDALGFAHISLRILSGQPDDVLVGLGAVLHQNASEYMTKHLNYIGKTVQLTFEVGEIDTKTFKKTVLSAPKQE